ncbi:hypothetical protein ACW9KT_22180 [Hymenobacter sp. HD11105]
MRTWISLHQPWLVGLVGILAAILLINWLLDIGSQSTRPAAARRTPGRPGQAPVRDLEQSPLEPTPANRAARRRATGKRALR